MSCVGITSFSTVDLIRESVAHPENKDDPYVSSDSGRGGSINSSCFTGSSDFFLSLGSSVSVFAPIDEPVGRAPRTLTIPIQENGLTRLTHASAPQWVLLCQMEGLTLVCKSFENVAGETVNNMMTEQFFLSHVDHPNIVKCVGEPGEISFGNEKKFSFFMEYLEFGGLDKFLVDKDENAGYNHGHLMKVEDATNIIVGACRALHYVHSKGYVHADISTDNFFAFRNPDNELLDVKLGDFESFYRPVSDGQIGKNIRSTPLYTAPEFILADPTDEKGEKIQKDAFKNDVWGLGLVLWELQSWIMCKNNKATSAREEESRGLLNTAVSKSRFVVSRLIHGNDYTCRRHVHVAQLRKINTVNPNVETRRPERILMDNFYRRVYPRNMGYPPMEPCLDRVFGWPITNLLKKCLAIYPANRPSMQQMLEYLLEHANENPESPLSPYKAALESDLNRGHDSAVESSDSIASSELIV